MTPFDVLTTFGKLPIGTVFERLVCDKDPRDRRRVIHVCRQYVKTRHGTMAGFARPIGMTGMHEDRLNHTWSVYVQSDLRLLVEINRGTV